MCFPSSLLPFFLFKLTHSLPSFFLSFPLSLSLFLFPFPFSFFTFLSFLCPHFFHPFFSSFFLSFSFFLSLPFLLSPCLSPLFSLASFLSTIHSLRHYINTKFNALKFSARDSFVVNHEFEGLSINDMADPSCANWVHHVQYVLPQVSCA